MRSTIVTTAATSGVVTAYLSEYMTSTILTTAAISGVGNVYLSGAHEINNSNNGCH